MKEELKIILENQRILMLTMLPILSHITNEKRGEDFHKVCEDVTNHIEARILITTETLNNQKRS